jgi:deazaflavin-dependent oxidoreductase (nitroreductase family)
MEPRTDAAQGPLAPARAVAVGRRVLGPILLRTGLTGVLEVPGRRTGRPLRITLAVWEVEAIRYLMSQYGLTNWVRNLRAAGGGQLRHKGRTQAFTAIEVEGEERDRVIAAFRAKADRLLKRDFDRLPNAADHATFRLEFIGPSESS